MNLSWDDPLLLSGSGDICDFFNSKESTGKTLFILGQGFDPRMCVGLEMFNKIKKTDTVWLIMYEEGTSSTSHEYQKDIDSNFINFKNIAPHYIQKNVVMTKTDEELGSKTSVAAFNSLRMIKTDEMNEYEDIIVDISALPPTISYSIINRLTQLSKNSTFKLYILVCENEKIDNSIRPSNLGEGAYYLPGFGNQRMDMASEDILLKVWLPLLGGDSKDELDKIYSLVKPSEICPILPFPSRNPRKSDDLLIEYRELLFTGDWSVEKRNIIYASELNPIQIYKKICSTIDYYYNTLKIISESKFVISTHGSKLMSIGVLMAGIKVRTNKIDIGFAMVDNEGYSVKSYDYNKEKENNKLYCLCLMDDILDG